MVDKVDCGRIGKEKKGRFRVAETVVEKKLFVGIGIVCWIFIQFENGSR